MGGAGVASCLYDMQHLLLFPAGGEGLMTTAIVIGAVLLLICLTTAWHQTRSSTRLRRVCDRIARVARAMDIERLPELGVELPPAVVVNYRLVNFRRRLQSAYATYIYVGGVLICEQHNSGIQSLHPTEAECRELLPVLKPVAEQLEAVLDDLLNAKEQRRREQMAKAIKEAKK